LNVNKSKSDSLTSGFGFTMVEIIVSLALLGTALIAVFTALRTTATAAHHSRMLTRSVLLAESLLADTLNSENLTFKTTTGKNEVFQWEIKVAPTTKENLAAISVKIKWLEQQRKQQYQLLTLLQMKTRFEGK